MDKWKIFSIVFNFCCIALALSLAFFWLYKFLLNEDSTTVEYQEYYGRKDDVIPVMTICFGNPFISSTVSNKREFNHSHLESYLKGKGTVELVHLDYENVTLQLTDYLISY